jgi:putative peptidoglycan lipid II flippase
MGTESSWFEIAAGPRALKLAIVIAAGAAAYFGSLAAMGFRIRDFSRQT